jgi:uncharacterized membrane protein YphA (DoxX/SURF4 family)
MSWLRRINDAIDEIVDYRALVPLRIAAGPLVVLHLRPFLELAADGITYRDRFWMPFMSWLPAVSGDVYIAMLWVAAVGGLLISIGLFTRVAAATTAVVVGYNLFVSQVHYHHNRTFLLVLLVGLAVVPVGRVFSLDALMARRRGTPLPPPTARRWPLMLLRFQVAAVYFASGFSKLVDPDWFGGTVTRIRVEWYSADAVAAGVPERWVDLFGSAGFHSGFAKVVVLTELFIAIGLLTPRLRAAAIWVAIPFHVAIQFSASVQVFTFAALAALVIWVAPTLERRHLLVEQQRRWFAVAVRWLDWTGRFAVEISAADSIDLRDSDGSRLAGRAAVVRALSLLPLSFWVAAPLDALTRRLARSTSASELSI